MKSPAIILLLLISLFSVSCKKCEDGKKVAFWNDCPPDPIKEKTKLLKKGWKVSKVLQTGYTIPIYQDPLPGGQSIIEDYSQYRMTFTSDTDYTLIGRNGATTSGKWQLVSNGTKFILDMGTSTERTYDIIGLTATLLQIRLIEESVKTGNRELEIDFMPA